MKQPHFAADGWLGMTYKIESIGKAMTALAAVLAFSSTPLIAQDMNLPDEPVADTSVETTTTSDSLVVESAAETTAPPAPKPKVETTAVSRSQAKSTATATASRPTTQRPSTNTTPTSPEVVESPADIAAPPPSMSPIERAQQSATPAAKPAPPSEFDQLMSDVMTDEVVPFAIAGAAGLGLLALLGTGILTRRRRLRREQEDIGAKHRMLADASARPVTPELDRRQQIRSAPAFVRHQPKHDPVPIKDVPVTKLPSGFDLSRFGPHVQAAYLGPTEDNPSLSLKYRLRRAAALDQQARRRMEVPAAVPARHGWETRTEPDFMLRRAPKREDRPSNTANRGHANKVVSQ